MAQKITLDLEDDDVVRLRKHAEMEEMTLEKFIKISSLRYIEQNELITEFELARLLEEENLLE